MGCKTIFQITCDVCGLSVDSSALSQEDSMEELKRLVTENGWKIEKGLVKCVFCIKEG